MENSWFRVRLVACVLSVASLSILLFACSNPDRMSCDVIRYDPRFNSAELKLEPNNSSRSDLLTFFGFDRTVRLWTDRGVQFRDDFKRFRAVITVSEGTRNLVLELDGDQRDPILVCEFGAEVDIDQLSSFFRSVGLKYWRSDQPGGNELELPQARFDEPVDNPFRSKKPQ